MECTCCGRPLLAVGDIFVAGTTIWFKVLEVPKDMLDGKVIFSDKHGQRQAMTGKVFLAWIDQGAIVRRIGS